MTDYDDMFEPCTAQTLMRVVPIGAKESVGGITVTLTALEIYLNGNGILRYLVHQDSESRRTFKVVPGPHIEVEDESSRSLPVQLSEGSASERTASGLLQVAELPESGNLTVRILRIAGSKSFFDVEDFAWQEPWTFEFRI